MPKLNCIALLFCTSAVVATFCMVPGRVNLHDVSLMQIGVEGAHQEDRHIQLMDCDGQRSLLTSIPKRPTLEKG
jgi:hypothetical protein